MSGPVLVSPRAEAKAASELARLFDAFLAELSWSVSARLRCNVRAGRRSIQEAPFEGLAGGEQYPLRLSPFPGTGVLLLDSAAAFALAEALLGASGGEPRALTAIERTLLRDIAGVIASLLRSAWPGVEFEMEAGLQPPPPDEPMLVFEAELAVGETPGCLRLALPALLVRLMGQDPPAQSRQVELLGRASVGLEARLSGPRIRVRDLLELQAGDVLALDRALGDPVDLLANGCPVFRGSTVAAGRRIGFQIGS